MAGSKAQLLSALDVSRHAIRGFTAAALVTLAVLAFFVLIPGSVHPTPYYLALAVVLALSLGALITAVLVARTAVHIAREP